MSVLRLGTRGSDLALAQAEYVAGQVRALGHDVEIVRVKTTGDVTPGSLVEVGGKSAWIKEIEDALYSHPGVMDAAVIGRPHRILGEEVVAVVQAAPGAAPSQDELIAHCRERIAAFKVPVLVEIRDQPLPRNANGKILKASLKQELFGA